MFGCILLRIGHIKLPSQVLDIEWGKPTGQIGIGEVSSQGGRCKEAVEHINGPSVKIGGIKKIAGAVVTRQAPYRPRQMLNYLLYGWHWSLNLNSNPRLFHPPSQR